MTNKLYLLFALAAAIITLYEPASLGSETALIVKESLDSLSINWCAPSVSPGSGLVIFHS